MLNAFAAETIIFSGESAVNDDGNTVFSVNITENSNVAGLSLTVTYDKEKMELLDAYLGEPFASAMSSINKNKIGVVYLSLVTTDPVKKGGSVIALVFSGKVTTGITFSVSECIDKDLHSLVFGINNLESDVSHSENAIKKHSQSSDASRFETDKTISDNSKETVENSTLNSNPNSTNNARSMNQGSVAPNNDSTSKNIKQNNNRDIVSTDDYKENKSIMPPATSSTSDTVAEKESQNSGYSIIWILLTIALCLALGIILFNIIKRRKKNEK